MSLYNAPVHQHPPDPPSRAGCPEPAVPGAVVDSGLQFKDARVVPASTQLCWTVLLDLPGVAVAEGLTGDGVNGAAVWYATRWPRPPASAAPRAASPPSANLRGPSEPFLSRCWTVEGILVSPAARKGCGSDVIVVAGSPGESLAQCGSAAHSNGAVRTAPPAWKTPVWAFRIRPRRGGRRPQLTRRPVRESTTWRVRILGAERQHRGPSRTLRAATGLV